MPKEIVRFFVFPCVFWTSQVTPRTPLEKEAETGRKRLQKGLLEFSSGRAARHRLNSPFAQILVALYRACDANCLAKRQKRKPCETHPELLFLALIFLSLVFLIFLALVQAKESPCCLVCVFAVFLCFSRGFARFSGVKKSDLVLVGWFSLVFT